MRERAGDAAEITLYVSRFTSPLPRSFYAASAALVAPRLLGHWLLRRTPEGFSGGLIVETEAYLADDPACHAFKGETVRNRSMFGPAGRAYVYFIYGNHWCFNAVCRPPGIGEAVLVRALEPTFGAAWMQGRRPVAREVELSNGPAKLCQALAIDRRMPAICSLSFAVGAIGCASRYSRFATSVAASRASKASSRPSLLPK